MQSIQNRRTIRKYSTKEVNPALLNELLESACRASTTGNMQLYSLVINRNKEAIATLAPLHFNQKAIQTAPVVITFCADFNRFTQWCEARNATPGYANFHSFLNAAIDTLLVAQNFCVLAEEQGLGICYLGTITYNTQQFIDALKLPKLVIPLAAITVGYADEMPNQIDRLPLKAVLHEETYQDYTVDQIDLLYQHKESLAENRQFIIENQKQTLAQVFTDVRYKKTDNERLSSAFLDVLKKQGFLE